jgi:tetratricopeptide (TPR) repeat protein
MATVDEEAAGSGRQHVNEGIEALQANRRDHAALWFSQGLDAFDRIEDGRMRRDELGSVAQLLDRLGFPDLALYAAGEAAELDEQLGDRRALAEDLVGQGNACLHLGRSAEAEDFYRRALAICLEDGHWDNAASAATNIAIIIGNDGRMDEAIALLQESLGYVERSAGHPSTEVITRMALLQALAATDREPELAIETAKPLLGRLRGELRDDQVDNTIGPLRACVAQYLAGHPGLDADEFKREHFPGADL